MQLKRQPNVWSCALYAYAMALDAEPSELIGIIGHDGSDIVFPELREPSRRRGFHKQELFDCAFQLGFSVMEVQVLPCSITTLSGPIFDIDFSIKQARTNTERFEAYLRGRVGVLNGMALQNNHAVAWDGETVYDPRGRVVPYDKRGIAVRDFHLVSRIIENCSFD